MKTFQDAARSVARALFCLTISLLLLAGCGEAPDDRVQGYVEGEFVYVSSPLAGTIEKLAVQRGQQVAAAAPLFALDETLELAARDQVQAALVLSEAEYKRQEMLVKMVLRPRRNSTGPVPRATRTGNGSRNRNGISRK